MPSPRTDTGSSHDLGGSLTDLLEFAEAIARSTGKQVRESVVNRADAVTKSSSADWLTSVDGEAEDVIRDAISRRYPTHAIIGEERPPVGDAAQAPIVWHVDPIDGTTNFLYGLGNVAISIAAFDAAGLAVGVVHDVYRNQTIGAARGEGLRLNRTPVSARQSASSLAGQVILTEWSGGYRAWPGMNDFTHWVGSEHGTVRILGSCALSLAHAGMGRVAATILPGEYNSWDVAAGVIIATEGGCELFDTRGPANALPAHGLLVAAHGVAQSVWQAWGSTTVGSTTV